MRFIPASRELVAEAQAQGQARTHSNDILRVERAEQRAPVHLRRRRIVEEAAGSVGQKRLQAGKRGLSVLAEGQRLVRLELLKPSAKGELMDAMGQADLVFICIKVARDGKIAAVVAARQSNLRLRIRGGASAHHHSANLITQQESGHIDRRGSRSRLAGEEVAGARIAEGRDVQQRRREDVRLGQAGHLLAQRQNVGAVGIGDRRRKVVTVIDGVYRRERVLRREDVVHASGAEVLTDSLQRTARYFRDAVEGRIASRRCRPKIQQRLHARYGQRARRQGRHKRDRRLVQVLHKTFVVQEEEGFVFLDWAAERAAELVALERRGNADRVEVVSSVQRAVTEEFVDVSVPLIAARLGDDVDLSAGMLAVL